MNDTAIATFKQTALGRDRRKILVALGLGSVLLGAYSVGNAYFATTLWSGLTAINPTPDVALPRAGPQTTTALRPSEIPAAQQALVDYLLAYTGPAQSPLLYNCDGYRAEAAP